MVQRLVAQKKDRFANRDLAEMVVFVRKAGLHTNAIVQRVLEQRIAVKVSIIIIVLC